MATVAPSRLDGITFPDIAQKVLSGQRISADEALFLFHYPNPLELAALADARRQAKVPGKTVT